MSAKHLKQFKALNYFEILGLDREGKDVSTEQVKLAYFSLAKKYHPDTQHSKIVDLDRDRRNKVSSTNIRNLISNTFSSAEIRNDKQENVEKFKLITDAYNTLKDDTNRKKYISSLNCFSSTPGESYFDKHKAYGGKAKIGNGFIYYFTLKTIFIFYTYT